MEKKEECCIIKKPKEKKEINKEKEEAFKKIFDEITETKKANRFMVIIAKEKDNGSDIKYFSNYDFETAIGITELIKTRIIFPVEVEPEKIENNMVG